MTFGFDQPGVARVIAATRGHENDQRQDREPAFGGDYRPVSAYRIKCRITAASEDGTTKRWAYTVTQVRKTAAGHAGWTDLTADDNALVDATAYNLIEKIHTGAAASTYGNNIAHDNLPGGYELKPAVAVGTPVECWFEFFEDEAGEVQRELWFEASNHVDGTCT